jgi:hypothetical protein
MAESHGGGVLDRFAEFIKSVFGSWATYISVGTFILYFLGYLALRFQLHALGVMTDLAVLDERYFFAGARFLLYLAASAPILLMLAGLLLAPAYGISRLPGVRKLPELTRRRLGSRVTLPLGIIFSIILIQVVMRACFGFSNILLGQGLPEPGYLRDCVLAEDDGFINLFFTGIMAGTLLNAAILYFAWNSAGDAGRRRHRMLRSILVFLVSLQFLLLPVNYGMLVVNRTLPRLADLGAPGVLKGRDAWLVWEGAEWITYLLREPSTGERSLLALPRRETKSIEIKCQDPILRILYLNAESPCAAGRPERRVS